MAVTLTRRGISVEGNRRTVYHDIVGPASYTTGGEALTTSDLNALLAKPGAVIGDILSFTPEITGGGHALFLNRATSKVQYFNGTTEIANAVNLSTFTSRAGITFVANK